MTSELFDNYPLASIAIRSVILLMMTFGFALIVRKRSAALVHRIWTLGFCGILLVPVAMLLVPNWNLPLLPAENPTPIAFEVSTARTDLAPPVRRANLEQAKLLSSPSEPRGILEADVAKNTQGELAQQKQLDNESSNNVPGVQDVPIASMIGSLPRLGFFVWCFGVVVFLSRIVYQRVSMHRVLRQCHNLDCDDWKMSRDEAAHQLGLRSGVPLKIHRAAASPMVAGVLNCVVVLPGNATTWSADRRKLVLLHELAHVRRRDVLTQTIAEVACAIYWFNPLAWLGAAQMKRLREIACDDTVVTHAGAPCDYADTLLDVAKHVRMKDQMFAVAMARNSDVESRIAAILDATRRRTSLTTRSACGIATICLLVSMIVGVLQLTTRAADDPKTEPQQAKQESVEKENKDDGQTRTMAIHVRDKKTGEPLAEANVFVNVFAVEHTKKFPNKTYKTDNAGVVEIAIPQCVDLLRIWPSKAGYVPLFLGFGENSDEEGLPVPDEYEFQLQRGSRLSGVVVDNLGEPVADAKVQVRVDFKGSFAKQQPIVNTWLAEDESAAVTDKDGKWQINNAPPRSKESKYKFELQVHHPDFAGDQNWGGIQERQGITNQALRDGTASLTLDRGIAVSGLVTGPDNKPITKGLVIWNRRPYWATGVNETQIDENGRYQTRRFKAGDYPITIVAPGFAPQQRTVQVSQSLKDVDFKLRAGNPIKIKIVDQNGAAVLKARISIGRWRGTEAIYNYKHSNVLESGIPRFADQNGVYAWDWAPEDAVKYRIYAGGYDTKEVTLVAKQEPHEVVLHQPIKIHGKVVDAKSGERIDKFLVVPVKAYRPDFYSTDFQTGRVAKGEAGNYEIQINSQGETGDRYRVRIEAQGYRTVLGQSSLAAGDPPLQQDFQLEPVAALVGTVLNPDGKPAADFDVAIGTATTSPSFNLDRLETNFGRAFHVEGTNEFRLAATFEPRRIRVFNDSGFAEILRSPDAQIGEIKLQPWAKISGRLSQSGQPIAGEWIRFYPLVTRELTEARFQDSFSAKTDLEGNFSFVRLPPMAGTVKASLGPWRDSVLTSSRAVPLELTAGMEQVISLGGDGSTVTGRVVATGRANDELSKQWSLNYLVRRTPGVRNPQADELGFDPTGPIQSAWLAQPDFDDWRATKENYFVKLTDDGRLWIHGVPAGEYDLIVQLYEQPVGCLVETIGEKVIPVKVTSADVEKGELEIGDIEVACRIGPRVGSDMRAFEFVDSEGRVQLVNDMDGRYVLFHVWASWCQPCLDSMPDLKSAVEQHASDSLTVIGLNIDADDSQAQKVVKAGQWNWAQNYLGKESDVMRQLAVSSAPSYYLIGPDGKLVASANTWATIKIALAAALE